MYNKNTGTYWWDPPLGWFCMKLNTTTTTDKEHKQRDRKREPKQDTLKTRISWVRKGRTGLCRSSHQGSQARTTVLHGRI
jgi:hypothetical protein